MRASGTVGDSRTNVSSEDPHAFANFIASRACRVDGRDRGDPDRRRHYRLALIVSLVVHGLLYVGIRQWSLLHRDEVAESAIIHLRLIDVPSNASPREVVRALSQELPAASDTKNPAAVPMPAPSVARRSAAPAVQSTPMQVANTNPPVNEGLALFDRDGRVVLPASSIENPAVFGFRKPAPAYARNPMAHESPLPYKPTPFERYWKPDGQTLLGEWAGKATRRFTHDTTHGTRVSCEAFLFLLACGWGPTPRVSIEELKAMRADPPAPRISADDPYLPPVP